MPRSSETVVFLSAWSASRAAWSPLRTRGAGQFNRALTVGIRLAGAAWRRADDALGVAIGILSTDRAYRDASTDGTRFDHAASRKEKVAEVYYRVALGGGVLVGPDFQYIARPGGEAGAAAIKVIGVRATLEF